MQQCRPNQWRTESKTLSSTLFWFRQFTHLIGALISCFRYSPFENLPFVFPTHLSILPICLTIWPPSFLIQYLMDLTRICRCLFCIRNHQDGKVVSERTFYRHRQRQQRQQNQPRENQHTKHCICRRYPQGHFLSQSAFYRHRLRLRRRSEENNDNGQLDGIDDRSNDVDGYSSGESSATSTGNPETENEGI